MITPAEFVHLPFTPDLTEGGITYAIRSLPHTYDRMGGSSFNRLRRIVAGVAVELAFRRHLSQSEIPFDVRGVTPFTDPDRYDVSLGGHRCDVKSFLISNRAQIATMRSHPEVLLNAPALVPLDQHTADGHRDDDLYLFAFLTGLVAASQADLRKALEAGQPFFLLHPLPKTWSRPAKWVSFAPVTLKSEAGPNLNIEIGGQAENREFLTHRVELPAGVRVQVDEAFHTLAYLHVDHQPNGRVGLHSPLVEDTHLIAPFDWGNIWVYGLEIILTGYLSHDEFQRLSSPIHPGSRVFQYRRTRTRNLAVPVAALKPLGTLFEKVKSWEATQQRQD